MKNILFVMRYGTMSEVLFKDLIDLPEVKPCYICSPLRSRVMEGLRRLHTSIRVLRYMDLPGKYVWYKRDFEIVARQCTHIVINLEAFSRMGLRVLIKLKKRYPKAKFLLLLMDSMNAHSFSIVYGKKYFMNFEWDCILSYDPEDCEKYGFTYIGMHYYSRLDVTGGQAECSNLFYIGAKKEGKEGDRRSELLNQIYEKASEVGLTCDFNVFTNDKNETVKEGISKLNKPLAYPDVLTRVMVSKCILELVQRDQHVQTARYMEAVCYNKKLLTNNTRIFELPYYDPRYMQYFEKPEDIDYTWVIAGGTCEYGYKGDFSPRKLIDMI